MRQTKHRVAVAMSGGVDSSVTALMLKQQGYEVFGITLLLSDTGLSPETFLASVEGVAKQLELKLHVYDLRKQFKKDVIDYFVNSYEKGLTPNPCVVCNQTIKFGAMLEKARGLGADYLATGHYCRIERKGDSICLLKGVDKTKDQSYFLYRLNQIQLKSLLFPLGDLVKSRVREIARKNDLLPADKKESQDLCFVSKGDYRELYRKESSEESSPGPIVDVSGKRVGTHKGLWNYTIGQRRGLGVPAGEPMYVYQIDVTNNTLVIATNAQRGLDTFDVVDLNYISDITPSEPFSADVKIRYTAKETGATITPGKEKRVMVSLSEMLPDVTPGQSAVFYQGEEVLGGGVIR